MRLGSSSRQLHGHIQVQSGPQGDHAGVRGVPCQCRTCTSFDAARWSALMDCVIVQELSCTCPLMCATGYADINVKVMGVVQPAQPNKLVPAAQKCFVLGYNQGYANLSTTHYLAVKNTANKGACCSLCQRDSRCVAWTRVAGDSPHASSDACMCHVLPCAAFWTAHQHSSPSSPGPTLKRKDGTQ